MYNTLVNDFVESKKYVQTLNPKISCRVSSSSNINIASPPSSIDSEPLVVNYYMVNLRVVKMVYTYI
jgi:hypothetical protein